MQSSLKMLILPLLILGVAEGATFLKSLHARNMAAVGANETISSVPGCNEVKTAAREIHEQAIDKGRVLANNHATDSKLGETIDLATVAKADLKKDLKLVDPKGETGKIIDYQIKKADKLIADATNEQKEVKELTSKIRAVKPGDDVPKALRLSVEEEAGGALKMLKDAKATKVVEADVAAKLPTYFYTGAKLTSPKYKVVKLTSSLWPSDYCIDFDVTVPSKANTNKYGYEGAIAILGKVALFVTHTKKLLKGGDKDKFGLMVIEQSNGKGPYYATKGLVKKGARVEGTFCYRESTMTPSFTIDKKTEGGYLYNPSAKYPTTRDVDLTFLSGLHTKDSTPLKGGALNGFQIREFKPETPTYIYTGGEVSAVKQKVVKLTSKLWPSDYCIDFDVTVPSKANTNKYGYEGTIAMLGKVDLVVTHTKKLLKGGDKDKFGFMVIEQSNGKGPYYATKGLVKKGSRVKGYFCYKESTNTPFFVIDGSIEGGYLSGSTAKYPTTRDVDLTFLSGSHTKNVEVLSGGKIHGFQIRKA